jgi:hypothetical protein
VPYYHCSEVEHPNGLRLTGPATRRAVSPWSEEEPTYEADRVYLFVGDGDPRVFRESSISSKPKFVYEVELQGELRHDVSGGLWKSVSCESAIVRACVCRPPRDPELRTAGDGARRVRTL